MSLRERTVNRVPCIFRALQAKPLCDNAVSRKKQLRQGEARHGLLVMILGLICFFRVHTPPRSAICPRGSSPRWRGRLQDFHALVSAFCLALLVGASGFARPLDRCLESAEGVQARWGAPGVSAGGELSCRRSSCGRLLCSRPHLHDAETSDADGHQAVGGAHLLYANGDLAAIILFSARPGVGRCSPHHSLQPPSRSACSP